MQLVPAGLCCRCKKPAGRVPVFRAELIGEKRKLRDRFLDNRLRRTVDIHAIVIHAVDREAIETRPGPANGTARAKNSALLRGGPGSEDRQFFHVSAQCIDRKFVHLAAADARTQFGRRGLDQFSAGRHFDTRRNRTDFQFRLEFRHKVGLDVHSLAHVLLEPVLFNSDRIAPNQQTGEYIGAFARCRCARRDVRRLICNCHLGIKNPGATHVRYDHTKRSIMPLCGRRNREHKNQSCCQQSGEETSKRIEPGSVPPNTCCSITIHLLPFQRHSRIVLNAADA